MASLNKNYTTKGKITMKKKLLAGLAVGAMMFGMSTSSMASVIVLDFEDFPYSGVTVGEWYNTGGGPNYGISFADNFRVQIDGSYTNTPSPTNVLYYEKGAITNMNVHNGFDTGFSFYYTASSESTITVYDALGKVLATRLLPVISDPWNVWNPVGVNFTGTAYSVNFGGSQEYVGFDNITLGSATPITTPTPEPASMMLLGTGLAGLLGARKLKKIQAA